MLDLPDLPDHLLVIVLGALAGGYVSGLAGFGTALTTAGIWLHVLPPATSTILALFCSVSTQLQTIKTVWREVKPGLVLPFVIPGLLGVPVGLWALGSVDPKHFKIGVGTLLVAFPAVMFFWRNQPPMEWGGRWADGAIGFLGGVLGGLAGLSGSPPTVWATLRGWGKDKKRAVFQVFNLSILGLALAGQIASGRLDRSILVLVALCIPCSFIGGRLGVATYARLSDRGFTDLVLALLAISGAMLLII